MGDLVNATLNITNNATNRFQATTSGILVADFSLLIMAVFPIFLGALKSVVHHQKQKDSGEQSDFISHKDAAIFPLTASATLLGLYIFFKIFSKQHINFLVTGYFFILGVVALTHIKSGLIAKLLPSNFPNYYYKFTLKGSHKSMEKNSHDKDEDSSAKTEDLVSFDFDRVDLLTLAISSLIGVWYLFKKHWIANNIFGLAFATNAIELLQLNRISTGMILLGGLFIYDIFWVFGTNVMVTVAKSFEAPIKLLFPLDILEKGLSASNFAMLGLGDIVIPGIFIALILRFENSIAHSKGKQLHPGRLYFYSTLGAYVAGLIFTTFILHFYKHAQPALLYLVPACVGTPFIIGAFKGELAQLMSYEDNPEKEIEQEKEELAKKVE